MKLIENDKEVYMKALISGRSGSGKSSLAATAPNPLVLLSERQGGQSILDAAARLGVPAPQMLYMETIKDYGAVLKGLQAMESTGKLTIKEGKDVVLEIDAPETVVLDSLTDACGLIHAEIFDAVDKPSFKEWGELKKRVSRFIRLFRDLPCHVLMLCLLDERTENVDGQEVTVRGPMMPMKSLGNVAMAASTVAGIANRSMTKQKEGDDIKVVNTFEVAFSGTRVDPIKVHTALASVEEPNFANWIEKIKSNRRSA